MKITIEIDCTPDEARAFLGLPDVRALQQAWAEAMQARLPDVAADLTPEAMMQSWAKAAQANMDWLPALFAGLTPGTAKGPGKAPDKAPDKK